MQSSGQIQQKRRAAKGTIKYMALFALFILLNIASKFNRFIISVLNKSYDQKTISRISYAISITLILSLMISAFIFSMYQRIKSLKKCRNIQNDQITSINKHFNSSDDSTSDEQKIGNDNVGNDNVGNDSADTPCRQTKLQAFNDLIERTSKDHPKKFTVLLAVIHTISPVIAILIAVLVSEQVFKSQKAETAVIIILSIVGILTSIFVHFFINWATSYIRQHNAESLTSQLRIFSKSEDKRSEVKKSALQPIKAGCRTFFTSGSYLAYIVITQTIQSSNIDNKLLIVLISLLCLSSAIQIYDIASSCLDYKTTMMEIDNKLNIIREAQRLIGKENRVGDLEVYKKSHCRNKQHLIAATAIAIALFAIGEMGSLIATCLEKYKIIDERLSLMITFTSFFIALLSTILYCIYLPNVSRKQDTLMDQIEGLSEACKQGKGEELQQR
ncbi:MAG: hypothetical protein OEY79_01480 [Anaplasmataceae bacterium]|nr:hypothetical protein [Anaplasmataceae bacterium]